MEDIGRSELKVFVCTLAEMFEPEERAQISKKREDRLLKIVQYMIGHNLTIRLIRQWYTNVFKIDKTVRDVSGWKDVSVRVHSSSSTDQRTQFKQIWITSKDSWLQRYLKRRQSCR